MSILALIDAQGLFNIVWEHMSYFWVFLFMTIESSFIPFPSEIVVPPAAFIAMKTGEMTVVGVGVAATAGALFGSIINYVLAMWIGRPIVYGFARSRLGAICMITPDKIQRSEEYFDKHGAMSTFIGRLIPVIRQLISIPAGLARMNFSKFVFYTSAGAAIWNIILCGLGVLLAKTVDEKDLFNRIEYYNDYLSYFGYGIGVVCVLYIVWQLLKPKKNTQK
ncbi:MAG: DedA family protein [Muribaculaceae bacterium]|nr:DedA family protein [Muribaculaceae bacterium]MDE5659593.1 DedA family protein [Muribaculaceae bacterium]MDE6366238.1 DedA family protein [Muribaculaceae bacterium]